MLTGQDVPLQILRDRHEQLDALCLFQAFALRASWFQYLDETFGRDKVFELAYSDIEPTPEVVIDILGVGLPELDSGWTVWLAARYAASESADELGESYRAHLKAYAESFGFDDIYVCSDGVDF